MYKIIGNNMYIGKKAIFNVKPQAENNLYGKKK